MHSGGVCFLQSETGNSILIHSNETMFPINSDYSVCARKVTANPITGTVRVTFKSGSKEYRFTRVSRRAILSAVVIAPLSVGEWVNHHCWAN
jgi:hypothetical protein